MRFARSTAAFGLAGILLGCVTAACGASAGGGQAPHGAVGGAQEIPGLDPEDLTARERNDWSAAVAELPAPCPGEDVTLKQCVAKQVCPSCVPAVRFLFSQVRRGKTPAQVAAAYRLRFAPEGVRQVEPGDSPTKGAPQPTVLIVEWADFECSACAATAPLLDRKVKMFPDHVGLVFKHYPIERHQNSEPAARAAVAAGLQGRFWRLHDLMFLNQHLLAGEGVRRLAREAGLNMPRFEQDWVGEPVRQAVARDARQADELGLQGTPMLFVNGRHFDYDHFSVLEDLDEWIQLEIEIKTGERVEPVAVTSTTWPDPNPDPPAPKGNGA